jgi:hypothetical protein
MKELNEYEAKSLIKTNTGFIAIFWYSDDCPVCEQFLNEELPNVEKVMDNWSLYKINFDKHIKENGVFFEAARMPMGYFFKDNSRLFVGDGFAPSNEVMGLMRQLENPNFKTEQEIENEQLAALDN